MTVRSKVAMLVAEFMGTAVLSTVAINISRSQIGIGYFVAIGVGLALGLLVLALGPTSGGHFNPAVTIGMWTLRKIQTVQAIAYLAMQMLGGLAAWQLANYFVGSELQNIAGKESDVVQRAKLAELPDIVVATPARASVNVNNGALSLKGLAHLVIDEGDLVMGYGFQEDLDNLSKNMEKGVQIL